MKYLRPAHWVRRDEIAVLRRYVSVFIVHDVEQRLVDFPNVVEECHAFDAAHRGVVESCTAGERHAVRSNPSNVRTGDGIVGIDGIEQGFERSGREPCRAAGFAMLTNEERANAGAERE